MGTMCDFWSFKARDVHTYIMTYGMNMFHGVVKGPSYGVSNRTFYG